MICLIGAAGVAWHIRPLFGWPGPWLRLATVMLKRTSNEFENNLFHPHGPESGSDLYEYPAGHGWFDASLRHLLHPHFNPLERTPLVSCPHAGSRRDDDRSFRHKTDPRRKSPLYELRKCHPRLPSKFRARYLRSCGHRDRNGSQRLLNHEAGGPPCTRRKDRHVPVLLWRLLLPGEHHLLPRHPPSCSLRLAMDLHSARIALPSSFGNDTRAPVGTGRIESIFIS